MEINGESILHETVRVCARRAAAAKSAGGTQQELEPAIM